MISFNATLGHNAFTACKARKSADRAGYWAEVNTLDSIEQNPMQTASFYKDSGN